MGWTEDFVSMGTAFYPQTADGFHALTANTTLSFPLGRNAFIRRGRKKIYPNLWGLLIGESSITMKTSSIDLGTEMLMDFAKDYRLGNVASTEAFLRSLMLKSNGHDQLWWHQSEFGTVLATMSREYGAGMREEMCLLYDGDTIDHSYAKTKDNIVVPPLYVTLLAGITPEVCANYLGHIDLDQGFLQRFLVCFSRPKPFCRMPKPTDAMDKAFERVRDDLRQFTAVHSTQSTPTEFTLSAPADETYQLWTEDTAKLVMAGKLNGPTAKRLEVAVLKQAIIGEYSDQLQYLGPSEELDDDRIKSAISAINPYVQGAEELRSILLDQRDLVKAREMIRKSKRVSRSEVMKFQHIESDRMEDIEETLEERGTIAVEHVGRDRIYVLTEK